MFDRQKLHADAIAHQSRNLSGRMRLLLILIALVGAASFVAGITGDEPLRAWQVFLVNVLYFTGIAQGMVILAATLQMTSARWGRPIKRIAELGAYFLPLSVPLLIVLYFGRTLIFPWIAHPIPAKQGWLNVPFLFTRDLIGLLIMAALSLAFLRQSLRPDLLALKRGSLADDPAESQKAVHLQNILAPVLGIAFAVIYSLIAFDLIMSLDPTWYSTLFGAYYFITSFLAGMAGLVVILALTRKRWGLERYIGTKQFHDLGNLIFGFTIVAGDFFWSQFLVIWYGNLPEETRYVILRIREMPWAVLSYIVLFGAFAIPFVLLLVRKLKQNPTAMLVVAGMLLLGLWIEKFLLVVPSIWHQGTLPIGVGEILITLGFLAIYVLTFLYAAARHPILPVGDPLLQEELNSHGSTREMP
jgi:Ni/Fe-hydrogenase subunit HybB-like protein